MTDELRSLREHLRDATVYGSPGAAGDAWRETLLTRFPVRARSRRPESRAAELRRLALLVLLPMLSATALALWAFFHLPVPSLSGAPAAARLLGEFRTLPPGLLWLGLGAVSTLITFLVRGRLPRLLPLDW